MTDTDQQPHQRRGRLRWAATWIVVAALVGGVLTACGADDKPTAAGGSSSGSNASTTQDVTVTGLAYAAQPLQGAALSVSTADGKTVVNAQPDATSETGSFEAPAKLPPDFRVTVDGGTVGEAVFTGKLVADVAGYGPDAPPINVNPITTLMAAYHDRHPQMPAADVQAATQAFLQVPDTADLTGNFTASSDLFSNTEFQTQADAGGGVQPFVDQLVTAMDTPGATHAFVGPAENDVQTDAMKAAAKALAKLGVEEALKQFGFQSPDKVVANALAGISSQLNDVQKALDNLDASIKSAVFAGDANTIIPLKEKIDGAFKKLYIYANAPEPKTDYQASQLAEVRGVAAQLSGDNAQSTLNKFLDGDPNVVSDGAYYDLSQKLKTQGDFWTPGKSTALRAFFDYFDGIQTELMVLLADNVRQNKGDDNDVVAPNGPFTIYAANQARQMGHKPKALPTGTVVDVRSNLMWPVDNHNNGNTTWWTRGTLIQQFNGCFFVSSLPICDTPISPPVAGFKNWRMPSKDELAALVAKQTNPTTYLQLKTNWGTDALKRKDSGVITNVWSETPDPNINLHSSYALDLTTGKMTSTKNDNAAAAVLPVRVSQEPYWL